MRDNEKTLYKTVVLTQIIDIKDVSNKIKRSCPNTFWLKTSKAKEYGKQFWYVKILN